MPNQPRASLTSEERWKLYEGLLHSVRPVRDVNGRTERTNLTSDEATSGAARLSLTVEEIISARLALALAPFERLANSFARQSYEEWLGDELAELLKDALDGRPDA